MGVVVLTLLLTGCVLTPDTNDSVPVLTVPEREAALKAFKPWRAQGTIAIDSDEQGKFNASFAWNVDDQGYDIKLFGPLGVQAFHLTQNAEGAQLTDRSGVLDGDSAGQLLHAVLGSEVPIDKMQSWAVGLPGDATQIERDSSGRLDTMVVAEDDATDWKVNFRRYTVLESMYLPKSVFVEGDGVTINLSFRKWSRAEPADGGRLTIPGVGS